MNEAAIEMHQQHERAAGRRNARHLGDGAEPGVFDAELTRREIERPIGKGHVGGIANDGFHVRHARRETFHCGARGIDTRRCKSIVAQDVPRDFDDRADAAGDIDQAQFLSAAQRIEGVDPELAHTRMIDAIAAERRAVAAAAPVSIPVC